MSRLSCKSNLTQYNLNEYKQECMGVLVDLTMQGYRFLKTFKMKYQTMSAKHIKEARAIIR